MKITTLHKFDTEYSADSIEWCPHPEYMSYFVCGTYQLEEQNAEITSPPCRRKGRIYLFRFDKVTKDFAEIQRLETAAILDMKWLLHQSEQKPKLATANALGQVDVYELEAGNLTLRSSVHLNPDSPNLLALSLDWDWRGNEDGRRLLVSDSKGDISLLAYALQGDLQKTCSWSAHSFEAWICAFDKWDSNRVYSGGDDTFLHAYDLRSTERVLLNKSHIAGVTCLLSHPKRENILLTGSYDERMRIFDTRAMKQPISEINLNGGIWRLKSDPLDRNLIVAACMYHNFSVVKLSADDLTNLQLVGEYSEHNSICYGSDWCLDATPCDDELHMATCSFYDHKLCISSITEE